MQAPNHLALNHFAFPVFSPLELPGMARAQVEAEQFVTLLLREPFDYTAWRKDLWADETVDEISRAAMRHRGAAGPRRQKPRRALPKKSGRAPGPVKKWATVPFFSTGDLACPESAW